MPQKRSPRTPTVDFHMKTRSRARQATPQQSTSSNEDSSLSSLGSPPATPPTIPAARSHKRKLSDSNADDAETMPPPKRPAKGDPSDDEPKVSAKPPRKQAKLRMAKLSKAAKPSSKTSTSTKDQNSSTATATSSSPESSTTTAQAETASIASEATHPSEQTASPTQEPEVAKQTKSSIQEPERSSSPSKELEVPEQSSSPEQSEQPSSSPKVPEPELPRLRKRKSAEAGLETTASAPKRARATRSGKKTTPLEKLNFSDFKDKTYWPEFDPKNPTYYAKDGTTKYTPGENGETPESSSPKKSARGGARGGRGGRRANGNNGGGAKGKGKAKGNRGESPEPPNRKQPLSQVDKDMIAMMKTRQQELKRFFNIVGTQQTEMLEEMATRDLNRIAKKPNAHKKVPEYELIMEEIQTRREEAEDIARKRYDVAMETAMLELEAQKEVIEQQFKTRVENARVEHLAGAEGDIILFERAYRAAHDDTHTESGSDVMDYFPQYHEMPEPNAQPRGYSSQRITDEKSFKRQLEESYDEQARQEVLNEDVIGPLLQQMEQRNKEWQAEKDRKKTQNMNALSEAAAKELEKIEGYLVPRPMDMGEANSYALSALADVAEWTARKHPQQAYIYVPLAKGETLPASALDFSPMPGQGLPPPPLPPSRPRGRRLKYPPLTSEPQVAGPSVSSVGSSSSSSLPPLQPQGSVAGGGAGAGSGGIGASSPPYPLPGPSRMVSTGPGQPIAPAPPRPAAGNGTLAPPPPPPPPPPARSTNIFRHNTRYGAPATPVLMSPGAAAPTQPQQYIFQTPQQPLQHQSAPAPAPTTTHYGGPTTDGAAGASSAAAVAPSTHASASPGPVVGTQTKIPMTFVNQTIASRNEAAAAAAASRAASSQSAGSPAAGDKSGVGAGVWKRALLPKGAL